MSTATDTIQVIEPAERYHARLDCISRGMLCDFAERRRLFQGRYVLRNMPASESSDAFDIGTLAHAGLLEPHRFDELYTLIPSDLLDARGALSTKAGKEFAAECREAGRIPLKADSLTLVRRIVAAAQHRLQKWMGLPAKIEQSIYWRHPMTHLRCRCRPDWLIETPDAVFVIDFKTCTDASPDAFRKSIENYRYHCQDAHYSEGASLLTGKPAEFYFVAVEKKEPFGCFIYRIKPASRVKAENDRHRHLADLAACFDADDWRETWEDEVKELEIRDFCFSP